MKKMISLLKMLLLIISVNAQTPAGKWKLIEARIITVRGAINFLKEDYEKEPCLANVIYIFSEDGKIITNAESCPDSTRKSLEASNLAIKWETLGNAKITVSTKDKDIDPITYDLRVYTISYLNGGRKIMQWDLDFPDDPEDRNPDKAKKLYFVYYSL
jgi:hypothetical protein